MLSESHICRNRHGRMRLRPAKERLVPLEAASHVTNANDRPRPLHLAVLQPRNVPVSRRCACGMVCHFNHGKTAHTRDIVFVGSNVCHARRPKTCEKALIDGG